jgi:ABC-type transport system involved in multi-copper enzyme maturation permease subunit
MDSAEDDRKAYAGFFQYFYLRLAIFFGCLGIFMNLFRGEMLDKTLHFWFLAPARRETLLAGKYLAGLIAAVLIFTGGAAISFYFLLWGQAPQEAELFWSEHGPSQLFWYTCAAALGCLGYGSVFLAAGLLLRNPVIPAVTILFWEGINGFLPTMLQKFSVLYYVQSLCPVPAPMPERVPAIFKMILAPAEPAEPWLAFTGLAAVTALVLFAAAHAVRRLELNYGTD